MHEVGGSLPPSRAQATASAKGREGGIIANQPLHSKAGGPGGTPPHSVGGRDDEPTCFPPRSRAKREVRGPPPLPSLPSSVAAAGLTSMTMPPCACSESIGEIGGCGSPATPAKGMTGGRNKEQTAWRKNRNCHAAGVSPHQSWARNDSHPK